MSSTSPIEVGEAGLDTFMRAHGARLLSAEECARVAHLLPPRPSPARRLARLFGFRV